MKSKLGLVALVAITPLMLFNGTAVEAKSQSTDKKTVATETKPAKKAPEKPAPVYVDVQLGDTLSAIADRYQTSYVRIFDANESITHPDVIDVGQKFRIPDPSETLPDRVLPAAPEVQAAVNSAVSSSPIQSKLSHSARGSSSGNTYGYGWCTWYAKQMRSDLPNNLGNGGQWVANARAQGIATGTAPQVGAIAEQSGHVAYVEAVNGNMVTVSEMGYNYTSGTVTKRTVAASTFWGYIY
jgi:surface antigen